MVNKLIPEFLKESLRSFIRNQVDARIQAAAPRHYCPSNEGAEAYYTPARQSVMGRPFPVPPTELWEGYGPDAESYLTSGKKHVSDMIEVLAKGGFSMGGARRILEFGCASGRMIRHLPAVVPKAELWGVDINAQHIRWCLEHLAPSIHFATSTVFPHLPFEDRSFDLVFCGSVFTHIEDTAETWMLELGRILTPGGILYVTLHDEHTVKLLDTTRSDHWLANHLLANPVYRDHRDQFSLIVVGRREKSQVFYHSDFFRSLLPPSLRLVSYTQEAYGYQSAAMLQKIAA